MFGICDKTVQDLRVSPEVVLLLGSRICGNGDRQCPLGDMR